MGLFASRETSAGNFPATATQEITLPSGWTLQLQEQINALKNLSVNTESEFLSLGAEFHGFHGRSTEIVTSAKNMVAQIAGEHASAASAELHQLLGRMESFLASSEQETIRISDAFNRILALFAAVDEPLDNFKKINKVLRMLGTATKIESARMGAGAAGFETLANDVANMSIQVVERAVSVLKQKQELTATLEKALQQVSGDGALQNSHVRQTLQRLMNDIQLLDAVKIRCSSAVEIINSMSSEMADGISKVVMSMQSHDITRQQIEHVHEALSEISEHCERHRDGITAQGVIQEAGDICELQAAQLHHAADKFHDAVASIIADLQHLAEEAAGMAGQIGSLMGVADEAGSSFLVEMERALVFVNTALAESVQANQELSRVMERISSKVNEIALFVNEISYIGGEIELIAMNAQIKSARAGVEGAALGVLAEAIQRLSTETGELTAETSSILLKITAATEQLCAGVDSESSLMSHDVQEMVEEIETLMQSLRQVNDVLGDSSAGMQRTVKELGDSIAQAVSRVSAHDIIRQVSAQVENGLNDIVLEARTLTPSAIGGNVKDRLKRLAERYTMQSERVVHARISGSGMYVKPAVSAAPNPAAQHDDGLGDNVELF